MLEETLEHEVANLIVEVLNLRIDPAGINPEDPLFNSDLGLDSIDALELVMAISQRYGFQFRSDRSDNSRIFANLRSLAAHIQENRTS